MRVIVMRGITGAGKDTWIKNNLDFSKLVICSTDSFFTDPVTKKYNFDLSKLSEFHGENLKNFIRYCSMQYDTEILVCNNTNLSVAEYAPYVAIAQAYGHKVEIITIKTDPTVAAKRNIHGVPEDRVMKMAEALEKGTADMPPWYKHRIIEP